MSKVLVRPVLLSFFFFFKNQTLIIFKYDWKFLIERSGYLAKDCAFLSCQAVCSIGLCQAN